MATSAPTDTPNRLLPVHSDGGALVAILVPVPLAALLTGRRGGPLAWLLGAGSRSELVTAALIRGGLVEREPGR